MEITPDQYLDLSNVDMFGPSSIKPLGYQQPAPAPAPTTVDEVAAALRQAQLNGDHGAIGLLSVQLDDLVANFTAPNQQQPQKPVSDAPKAPEEPVADVRQSDLYQEINAVQGQEEADKVHSWMNENFSEDEVADYLTAVNSNDQEAIAVFQSAQNMMKDVAFAPSEDLEYTSFNESQAHALTDAFGEQGQELLSLNQQYLSGAITERQMQKHVLSNPSLMRVAMEAKAQGLINY